MEEIQNLTPDEIEELADYAREAGDRQTARLRAVPRSDGWQETFAPEARVGETMSGYEIGNYGDGSENQYYTIGEEDVGYEIGQVLSNQMVPRQAYVQEYARGQMVPMGQAPIVRMQPAPQRFPMSVTEARPEKGRVLYVGFRSTNPALVPSLATQNISSQPQDVFTPRKIIVPVTVAPSFDINDIKIGNVSQLSSNDPIPAELFTPDSVSNDVKMDTCQVSQFITFNVTNVSLTAATFRAGINGLVARL